MRRVHVLLMAVLSTFSPFAMASGQTRTADEAARAEATAKTRSQLNAVLGNSADSAPSHPKADPNMECMIGPTSIPVKSLFRQVYQLDNGGEQARLYFRPGSDGKTPPPLALGKEWLEFDLPGRNGLQAFFKREEGERYLVGKTIHFMEMSDKVVCVEQRARFGPFDQGTTEIHHKVATTSTGECAVGEALQNTNYGVVLNTLCANRGEFSSIYRRMSRRAPEQQGEITLWLSISEYGEVNDAKLIQSTMNSPEFEFRVLRAVNNFDFGRLNAGGWTGEQTLRFPQ